MFVDFSGVFVLMVVCFGDGLVYLWVYFIIILIDDLF